MCAIANATEIAYGQSTAVCVWDLQKARGHLIRCFEQGKMERFPILRERRIPFGGAIRNFVEQEIHCSCRMPFNKDIDNMIQCSLCNVWFHATYDGVDNVADYSRNWFCSKCVKIL